MKQCVKLEETAWLNQIRFGYPKLWLCLPSVKCVKLWKQCSKTRGNKLILKSEWTRFTFGNMASPWCLVPRWIYKSEEQIYDTHGPRRINIDKVSLGEWVKWFLFLNNRFPSTQKAEYLPQTLRQKSNTCMPLCLVYKFGSSVILFSNFFLFGRHLWCGFYKWFKSLKWKSHMHLD